MLCLKHVMCYKIRRTTGLLFLAPPLPPTLPTQPPLPPNQPPSPSPPRPHPKTSFSASTYSARKQLMKLFVSAYCLSLDGWMAELHVPPRSPRHIAAKSIRNLQRGKGRGGGGEAGGGERAGGGGGEGGGDTLE